MTASEFPLRFDDRGRTATAPPGRHLRDLIEQVLFTVPGERVNRPTFGCGLARLVFEANSPELAAATLMLVQGALQQWLGDRLVPEEVTAEAQDAVLRVTVRYLDLVTGDSVTDTFVRGGAP